MPLPLPAPAGIGQPTYNGFAFPANVRTMLRGTPVRDSAARTIVAMKYRLSCACVLYNSGFDVSATVANANQRLTKDGQALSYANNGSGNFLINVGGVRDVSWGPKCELIALRPLGSNLAWELVWECEFQIPTCSNAQYVAALMAVNYDVDFSIDADNYTTRTVTGYLEIPITRLAGGNKVIDSADAYYESIIPDVPPGFRRRAKTRKLSSDRKRLDFTFEDEQIPGGTFPNSISSFEGNQRVSTEPGNWLRFTTTLSASYVVPQGVPKTAASDAFFALLMNRSQASQYANRLFLSFDAEEGLGTNRRVSFSSSWMFISDVASCLADSGFYQDLPGATWAGWQASPGIDLDRGTAGLFYNPADDAIIDLCTSSQSVLKRRGNTFTSTLTSNPQGTDTTIKAEGSWIAYVVALNVKRIGNTARLKTIPPPTSNGTGQLQTGMGEVDALGSIAGGAAATVRGNPLNYPTTKTTLSQATSSGNLIVEVAKIAADIIQQRGTPSYKVTLTGFALRAGFHIPLPKLKLVGGVVPKPSRQEATVDTPIMNLGGVPIYYKTWRLEYDLDQPPDNATILKPVNPAIQIQN